MTKQLNHTVLLQQVLADLILRVSYHSRRGTEVMITEEAKPASKTFSLVARLKISFLLGLKLCQ
jgi:hypothetical protein